MEPPVSSPSELAQRKAAVAAPEPLLDAPEDISRSQGLRGVLNLWEKPVMANSVRFVFPRRIAPDLFRLATTVESSSGKKSAMIWEPPVVRTPLVQSWSLTATGIPCMGPR